jgi:transposase-like protein
MERYTIHDFNRDFPNDGACLDFALGLIYPDGITCRTCGEVRKHHRLTNRKAYSCDYCGTHVYPLAGTIFEKSSTPLKSWFYAMYLMASTRCGISAKQLERELGVTYKTAWRMFRQIRSMLGEETGWLSGEVEADEAYIGGRKRGIGKGRPGYGGNKTPVVGVVERGGKVAALVTKDASKRSIAPIIESKVMPSSLVYTDEWSGYSGLDRKGYRHRRIAHGEKVWVVGNVHTNTIEGFWSILKRGIVGVYHSVSAKHLQAYINEYAFRYNHRDDPQAMFQTVGGRIPKVRRGRFGAYSPVGR